MRMVDPLDAYERCQEVFEANRLGRPGMLPRVGDAWRDSGLADHSFAREGAGPLRCVVAEDADGRAAGFARYRIKEDWDNPARPDCKVRAKEVYGRDLASYVAMWRFLLDIDLTSEVNAEVPTDDPLMFLLADPRQAVPRLRDEVYVRLWMWTGRWRRGGTRRRWTSCSRSRIRSARGTPDGGGSAATPTGPCVSGPRIRRTWCWDRVSSRPPTSAVSRWPRSAGPGRVEELRPGALAEASRAFVSDVAPWLPFGF